MIQTGDPEGNGTGGDSIWGTEFEDEIREELKHDSEGILAMANCGKNTNGSQFYITVAPCKNLDGKHTVFGRVTGGIDVVKAINKIKTDEEDKPLIDVKMHRIRVKK